MVLAFVGAVEHLVQVKLSWVELEPVELEASKLVELLSEKLAGEEWQAAEEEEEDSS